MIKTLLSKKPAFHGFFLGIVTVATCTLTSLFSWRFPEVHASFAAAPEDIFQAPLKLFTTIFVHGDLQHLLSNSYMLLLLSIFLFGGLTRNLSHGFTLMLGFLGLSAVVNFLTLQDHPPGVRLIGASGLAYLMAGFWFTCFLFIDRRRSFGARLIRVIGVGLLILFPSTFEPSTSYTAHFHGFWLGSIFGALYFFMCKNWIRSFEEFEVIPVEPLVEPTSTEDL